MPYAGGVYTIPPGTLASTLTAIDSSDHNAAWADIEAAQNAARPVVAGGTGAQTASGARTALGLVIGTDVQAYDADLAGLAAAFTTASASGPASLALAEDTDNGSNKVTLKAPASIAADVDLTLPGTADTLVGRATTDTLTNKRITPRVTSEASSATPTINTDNSDAHSITALATAITSMTTNLSGTPTNFQRLLIRIKDNGTARAISWGASFEAKGVALPTTTVLSKVLTVLFIYDTVTSKWGCVAVANEA